MFMGLKAPLKEGDMVPVTLVFEQAKRGADRRSGWAGWCWLPRSRHRSWSRPWTGHEYRSRARDELTDSLHLESCRLGLVENPICLTGSFPPCFAAMSTAPDTPTPAAPEATPLPGHRFVIPESAPLVLDCAVSLAPITVAYQTYGHLNADRSNAVLVCHALTVTTIALSRIRLPASPAGGIRLSVRAA